jgi:C-5 cytosine-specific DNA methylase
MRRAAIHQRAGAKGATCVPSVLSGAERPLAIDLFSGTGGATAAFRDAGWRVVTVDLVRRQRPAVVADVRALPIAGRPTLLWASPPCTEFSDANPNRPARPSLELVHAAMNAIADLQPRYWIIENVRGAIPYLGIPVQKIGPWCLWGYFPPIDVTLEMQLHRKSQHRTALRRGAVPYELSAALLRAVQLHAGVGSLLDMRPFRRHRHVRVRTAAADQAALL